MSIYYHLRLDAPSIDFIGNTTIVFFKKHHIQQVYFVSERSDSGKLHFHAMVLMPVESVQPLRQYLGVTYKKALKNYAITPYWNDTYGDSKKIQVYSLSKVKFLEKMWSYMHKDVPSPEGPDRIAFRTTDVDSNYCDWSPEWSWKQLQDAIQAKKDKKKEEDNKFQKELDDFWTLYKSNSSGSTYGGYGTPIGNYYYPLQMFYDTFRDLSGFRVHFLKSAHRNGIIDFNTYMDKMYRL